MVPTGRCSPGGGVGFRYHVAGLTLRPALLRGKMPTARKGCRGTHLASSSISTGREEPRSFGPVECGLEFCIPKPLLPENTNIY